jgi:hypothetical protein
VRRSGGKAGKGAIHMVSAFAASQRLVLGQVKVAGKSNEITAISRIPSFSCSLPYVTKESSSGPWISK